MSCLCIDTSRLMSLELSDTYTERIKEQFLRQAEERKQREAAMKQMTLEIKSLDKIHFNSMKPTRQEVLQTKPWLNDRKKLRRAKR